MDISVFYKRKEFFPIIIALFNRNNVYLWGTAGSGKTQLAKACAHYIIDFIKKKHNKQIELYELSINQWTSPIDLIGGETPSGYREGLLSMAWKNGGVLLLDELPKIEPNTSGILNMALAQTKIKNATISNGRGEKLIKHDNFYVIATGNTDMRNSTFNYGANYKQDFSLIDRFSGAYFNIEKDENFEKALILKEKNKKYLGLYDFFSILRNVIEIKEINQIISIRTILSLIDMFEYNYNQIVNKKSLDIPNSYFLTNYFQSSYTKDELKELYDETDEYVNKNNIAYQLKSKITSEIEEYLKIDLNNISFIDLYIKLIDYYDGNYFTFLEESILGVSGIGKKAAINI